MTKSLLKLGLASDEYASACAARDVWQSDGRTRVLRITEVRLRAIGVVVEDAEATAPAQDAPVAPDDANPKDDEDGVDDRPRHEQLGIEEALIYGPAEDCGQPVSEAAAEQVLAAWDGTADEARLALPDAMSALRAALATKPSRPLPKPGTPRKSREGTNQEAVLALLRREQGATIAQICEATSWQQHTAPGLPRCAQDDRITIKLLERGRQVGPGMEDNKRPCSVY